MALTLTTRPMKVEQELVRMDNENAAHLLVHARFACMQGTEVKGHRRLVKEVDYRAYSSLKMPW
jgi:hypothetical protein